MASPSWLSQNYTEPRVLSVVRDLCTAGTDVLDVGANFGGITIAMSRAVGPRGAVYAFEANPEIAGRCQDAVIAAGCGNVQIVHGAIYSKSGETIDLYLSDNQVADSIHYRVSDKSIKIPTLALDDYIIQMKAQPSFVKMDIEGAEYDALVGFEKTIRFSRPLLILEQSPSEHRCVEFLLRNGYNAIDLSTYKAVRSISDVGEDTVVTDILFGHGDSLERLGYAPGLQEVQALSSESFQDYDLITRSRKFDLRAGRYVVQAEYASSDSEQEELLCGILRDGSDEPIMQYHGHSHSLAKLGHRWVFNLPHDGSISIFFRFFKRKPSSFEIGDIRISRVTCSGASSFHLP